jgi:hypothetical protein
LNSFSNGSLIGDNSELQFTPYSIDYAMYEWNKDSNVGNMTDEGYSISVPLIDGVHNLTVTTYDEFESVEFFYIFTVDANAPIISLLNLINDTTQPAGKVIDVNITDNLLTEVFYKWDDQDNLPWSPFSGSIFRTYLLGTDGYHTLIVSANDSYGHLTSEWFRFYTDGSVLGVELQNLVDNSYYYGGNDVNLTITGSNTTVYYRWDNGTEKKVILTESFLLLTGIDALPTTAGFHNLTVRTFDLSDVEDTFIFYFTIDQEAPVIDSSIYYYDYSRKRTSDIFTFVLSDNEISDTELIVFYSINGSVPQSLDYPFNFLLTFFTDGNYNLTLYVYDIANNLAIASIVFTIDMTPPIISSVDIIGLIQITGTNYIPADSTVTVTILDDDLSINSTYSWGGSVYFAFTGSFLLSYPDGGSTLFINASDSLDNNVIYSIDLTIDNQAPTITIISPSNETKINHDTKLSFVVDDIQIETVDEVETSWDLFYPASSPITYDALGIFELWLYFGYDEFDLFAQLFVITTDVVGNSEVYMFNFTVDVIAPLAALYINETETGLYKDASDFDFIQGNTSIWYDTSQNSDLNSFTYYWDNDKDGQQQLLLIDPFIYAPIEDGYHNLTVILLDDTEGSLPNKNQTIFFFYVDDIKIEAIDPINLLTVTHNLIYGDVFSFTIKIYDAIEDIAITNLFWNQTSLNNSNNLDLIITNTTINSKTFQFSIIAANVSDTILIFEFSEGESNTHKIFVSLSIAKKEGYIVISDNSELNTIYESDIIVEVSLKDEVGTSQEITRIYANGTEIEDFDYLGDYVYQFRYSSYNTTGKGNYILDVRVESIFHFGITNSSYSIEIEIQPLQLSFQILVSDYNITEGSNVVVHGLLEFLNGTPLEDIDVYFYIFIYHKTGVKTVLAFSGFDNNQTFLSNTNSTGYATTTFLMTEEIDYIQISASFEGKFNYDGMLVEFEDIVRSVKPSGLPPSLLYSIIAAAVVLMAIISFIIYKLTRSKPFEELLEEVEEEEIFAKMVEINPGVFLNIFDQKKGAIPLVTDHNLDGIYVRKLIVGVDNFLLKIADQAYSSLGFEDHHDRRRIGSILLPKEGMVGLIHGIQLPNPAARGGYENLTLVVLVNEEHDTALLSNQTHLFDEIDELTSLLLEKSHLDNIRRQLNIIRKKTTRIVLAALNQEPVEDK